MTIAAASSVPGARGVHQVIANRVQAQVEALLAVDLAFMHVGLARLLPTTLPPAEIVE